MGLGRMLVLGGIALIVIGVVVMLGERLPIKLGRLPGDIFYQGKNGGFYFFPIVTCAIISALVSLVMWLINRR